MWIAATIKPDMKRSTKGVLTVFVAALMFFVTLHLWGPVDSRSLMKRYFSETIVTNVTPLMSDTKSVFIDGSTAWFRCKPMRPLDTLLVEDGFTLVDNSFAATSLDVIRRKRKAPPIDLDDVLAVFALGSKQKRYVISWKATNYLDFVWTSH